MFSLYSSATEKKSPKKNQSDERLIEAFKPKTKQEFDKRRQQEAKRRNFEREVIKKQNNENKNKTN